MPIWPLTGETRRPEHFLQPVHSQMQPHKHVVHVEVHGPIEPPNELQVPYEALDQIGHPSIPKDPI